MFAASSVTQFLLMFGVPIAVALWLNRRLGLSWFLFFGGALAFVSAWVVTNLIPLPVETSLILLSITQMGALYLIYRFQLKTARTEREALMAGVGQGGLEVILLGIFAALSLLQVSQLRNTTDANLINLAAQVYDVPEEEIEPEKVGELRDSIEDFWNTPWYGPLIQPVQSFVQILPLRKLTDKELISLSAKADDISEDRVDPEKITALRAYVESFWNTPWYGPLIHPLQSLSLLLVQTALAVIVLGALIHNRWRPLIGAMGLHFLSRILPLYGLYFTGHLVWLGLSLLAGGIALWFLRRIWPDVQEQTKTALKERRKAAHKRAS